MVSLPGDPHTYGDVVEFDPDVPFVGMVPKSRPISSKISARSTMLPTAVAVLLPVEKATDVAKKKEF
jgi:hypothetical protein